MGAQAPALQSTQAQRIPNTIELTDLDLRVSLV